MDLEIEAECRADAYLPLNIEPISFVRQL